MSITQCKPQEQTQSIRVSASLRGFLELSRQVIANGRGDAVSISDIARILLESAKEDRMDFRLESPNCSNRQPLRSGRCDENGSSSSCCPGAEWVFLAQYVQVACEELPGTTGLLSPDSFIALPEALLAVRSLRTDPGGGLDRFYLASASQSLQPSASANSTRNFCRTPFPI